MTGIGGAAAPGTIDKTGGRGGGTALACCGGASRERNGRVSGTEVVAGSAVGLEAEGSDERSRSGWARR